MKWVIAIGLLVFVAITLDVVISMLRAPGNEPKGRR